MRTKTTLIAALILSACTFGADKPAAADKPIKTLEDILAAVPKDLLPKKDTDWTDAKIQAVNDALKPLAGRSIEMTIPIQTTAVTAGKVKVVAGQNDVKSDHLNFRAVAVSATFADAAAIAHKNKGDRIAFAGTIKFVRLMPGFLPRIDIEAVDCTLAK